MAVKSRKPRKQQTTDTNHANAQKSNSPPKPKTTLPKDSASKNGNTSLYFMSMPRSLMLGMVVLASVCGVLHCMHVSSMFENDRFFSHLSDLEREMTFRTEMGLYYSYYKSLVNAPSFLSGMYDIMNDNITEFPSTINVLKRFNLYPELTLAAGFRVYDQVTKKLGIMTRRCYTVNRGRGLSPVLNCEGLGDMAVFYVNAIFVENGLLMSIMFLFASYLSGSLLGGIVTVGAFFYNHGECTRVQWTPPLRESMAYPIFILQMFLFTHTLRLKQPGWVHSLLIAAVTTAFLLPWQFAQFALVTQTLAVCASYILGYTSRNKLTCIIQGESLGLVASYILLFGNEMLLTSFYTSCLLAVWVVLLVAHYWKHRPPHPLLTIGIEGTGLLILMVTFKVILTKLLGIEDDAHIANLFRSKFSNYKDFHTMLYTCAAEFDFMETQTPVRYMKTLLLPTALFAVLATVVFLARLELKRQSASSDGSRQRDDRAVNADETRNISTSATDEKPHGALVYHLFQLLAFIVMAIIIMRLKLFLTPHLCLISSLLASRQVFGWIGSKTRHNIILCLILGLMSIGGIANLQHQWSIKGDFSNAPQEEMLEWINSSTPKHAVFAGPMPTMASIKLSTLRPIVNHPHYEDIGLRARTKVVYGMYSRKPAQVVYDGIKALKANYAVLEHSWCVRRTRPGCSLPEVWDIEDPENAGKEPLCIRLRRNPAPYFREVFRNDVYTILKL